jgi:hypothetical protein
MSRIRLVGNPIAMLDKLEVRVLKTRTLVCQEAIEP